MAYTHNQLHVGLPSPARAGTTAARLSIDFGASFSDLQNDTAARFVYYDDTTPPIVGAMRTPGFDTPWPLPTAALSPDSGGELIELDGRNFAPTGPQLSCRVGLAVVPAATRPS
jgi:hypothetical protein